MTYEQLLEKLVNDYNWTTDVANKFIAENAKDEKIREKALLSLQKESEIKSESLAELPKESEIEEKPKVNVTVNNMPKKNKKFKLVHKIAAVVMTISIAGLAIMTPGIVDRLNEYQANENLNQEVASLVVTDDVYQAPEEGVNYKDVDFSALKQINQDAVGWLEWQGTNVDYPVVQGNDNDYYLRRSLDGNANSAGTLFIVKDNSANVSDDVTVIFGHNMRNDSMFGMLSNLQSQEFYNEHPVMYYHTEDAIYEIDLFAAVNQDFYDLTHGNYNNEEDFVTDMQQVKQNSTFQSDVQVDKDSKVLVLSTCLDSGSNTSHRFLVYGTVNKVLDKTMDYNVAMTK